MKTLLRGFGRQLLVGATILLAFTAVLGIGYPVLVWGMSRTVAESADGAVVYDAAGCPVGSALIGVDLEPAAGQPDPFLHGRPSGDPAVSGASNLGPNSPQLRDLVNERRATIAAREGVDPAAVPADAVTGSGSGLDPNISPAYAALQIPRLARTNGMTVEQARAIVDRNTAGRQLGVLGVPRVNVRQVNLDLGHRAPACSAQSEPRGR